MKLGPPRHSPTSVALLTRVLMFGLLLSLPSWAGARYKLAYKVTANSLIRMVANAADLTKWESAGDEIVLEGTKIFVKGDKTGFILDHAQNELILLDHETKTFERTTPQALRTRIAADFPPGIEAILKSMYPATGKPSTEVAVTVLRAAEAGEKTQLHRYRAKFGLNYLLPGVDSIVAFTPHIEGRLAEIGKGEATPTALRFAIGGEGKILDARVEILDYREEKVSPALFEPPAGYSDVAKAPI